MFLNSGEEIYINVTLGPDVYFSNALLWDWTSIGGIFIITKKINMELTS